MQDRFGAHRNSPGAQRHDRPGKGDLGLLSPAFLNVHYAEFPLPHVQQVADVEELLLAMQAKLPQWLRSRATPEAVELLPVDPKGVPELATPAQYLLEDIMQIAQFSVVAH